MTIDFCNLVFKANWLVDNKSLGIFSLFTVETIELHNLYGDSIIELSSTFYHCMNLKKLTFDNVEFTNVKEAYDIFQFCEHLVDIEVRGNKALFSKLRVAQGLFGYTGMTDIDISKFIDCSIEKPIKAYYHMFSGLKYTSYLNLASLVIRTDTDIEYKSFGASMFSSTQFIGLRINLPDDEITRKICLQQLKETIGQDYILDNCTLKGHQLSKRDLRLLDG